MSTYCNVDDIKLRIDSDSYTSLTGDDGTLTGDTLTTAIIVEIDGYMREMLSKTYTDVTLLEGSYTIKDICIELSICSLMKRRQLNGILIDSNQKERCVIAFSLLDEISNGNKSILIDGEIIAKKTRPLGILIESTTIDDATNKPYWYVDNE